MRDKDNKIELQLLAVSMNFDVVILWSPVKYQYPSHSLFIMKYFELFDIPVQLQVDKASLREKYFELSRKFHPDYFVNNSSEDQGNALESSALLNKAFKTFSSIDETLKYVLQEKGLLQEEEKYQLSPEFLMEMMELNEAVSDANISDNPSDRINIIGQLKETEKELYEPVQNIIENYQEGVTTEEELLQVKDYYFRKKYINRLVNQLDQKS